MQVYIRTITRSLPRKDTVGHVYKGESLILKKYTG